jgi:hypothetical protein
VSDPAKQLGSGSNWSNWGQRSNWGQSNWGQSLNSSTTRFFALPLDEERAHIV